MEHAEKHDHQRRTGYRWGSPGGLGLSQMLQNFTLAANYIAGQAVPAIQQEIANVISIMQPLLVIVQLTANGMYEFAQRSMAASDSLAGVSGVLVNFIAHVIRLRLVFACPFSVLLLVRKSVLLLGVALRGLFVGHRFSYSLAKARGVGNRIKGCIRGPGDDLRCRGFHFAEFRRHHESGYLILAESIVRFGSRVQYLFTEGLPAYVGWFVNNFGAMIYDAVSLALTAFTNLGKSLGSIFRENLGFLQDCRPRPNPDRAHDADPGRIPGPDSGST